MATQADGTVYIDSRMNTDGVEIGAKEIKKALEKTADVASKIGESSKKSMSALLSETKSVDHLRESLEKALAAKKNHQKIGLDKNSQIYVENAKRINELVEALEAQGVSTKEFFQQGEEYSNKFLSEIEKAKATLEELEKQGKWFGDEDYDQAVINLERLEKEAKEYKKELLSPTPDANPFGLDTMSGKIVELETQLRKLIEAGKGLGDPAYDEVYRKLALAKDEAKQYAAELSKTPAQIQKEADALAAKEAKAEAARKKNEARIDAELQKMEQLRAKEVEAAMEADRLKAIGDNAEISDQHIVDLNNELQRLKERQADLSKAGVGGLGFAEFEQNAARIAEIQQELRNYQSSLSEAEKTTTRFSDRLRKAFSGAVSVVKKAAVSVLGLHKNSKKLNGSMGSGLKTILKYGLGIRSLYVLFNKVRNAIKEGFKNLAQYSDEVNGSLSALKSSSTQLKNSLATAFAPILTVIEPILTRFINLLSQVITYVGMFFAALTGANSFTKAVAVQEDYAASLGDTAENAKEAKKYLSGLDEIRTYSEDKDASGGGAGGVSPSEMFETVPIESKIKAFADKVKEILLSMFAPLKQAWDKYGDSIMETLGKIKDSFVDFGVRIANSTIDWFKNLNWEPLLASVDNLLKKLQPLIDLILNGLAWAYENVLLPFGKWTIEAALPAIITALGNAFEFVRVVLERLEPVFTWLWENVLKPFGATVGNIIVDVIMAFGGLLEFLTGVFSGDWEKAFSGLKTVGESLRDAIFSIFDFIENILNVFDEFLQGVFAKDWTESFGFLGNIINDFFDLVEVVWNLIKGVFDGVIQFFRGVFTGDWEQSWNGIKQIFSSIWEAIKGVVQVAVNYVKNIIVIAWELIKSISSTIWNGIKNSISTIWNTLKTMASTAFNSIKTTITNIWNSVKTTTSNVWNGIKNTVSNIWNTISSIISKLTSVFTNAVSTAKTAASNIISAFSNIHIPLPHFSISSSSHSIGGISFSLPSVSVDWYGKGGLFDQPSVIGVGEAGQEAVLPLTNSKVMSLLASNIVAKMPTPYLASGAVVPPKSASSSVQVNDNSAKNMESIYDMLNSMASTLSQNQGLGGDINLTVQLDSTVVFRKVIDRAKLQQTVSGRNPFLLGT